MEQAIKQNLVDMRNNIAASTKQLSTVEQRISDLEDELLQSQTHVASLLNRTQDLKDKLYDLENQQSAHCGVTGIIQTTSITTFMPDCYALSARP